MTKTTARGAEVPQLRRLRQRLAISQVDLAYLADVDRVTVNKGENGSSLSWSTIRALAKALGVHPEELTKEDTDGE